MAQSWLIQGGTVVTPEQTIADGVVVLFRGKIAYVGASGSVPDTLTGPGGSETFSTASLPTIDASDGVVVPGYVDIHIHGGGGADTMNATVEAIETIAKAHVVHGTTGFLPTTMTAPHENVVAAAKAVKKAMVASTKSDWAGARVLGMHVEGPYIHPKMIGAQNPNFVRHADIGELDEILSILADGFRLITLAPELPGAIEAIEWLVSRGITVSMGHTAATHEQALAGIAHGVSHATHSFNAMTGLHHREPGVVGTLLTEGSVRGELIADGIHVHPTVMKVLAQSKGATGLCLITDAMEAMGMPDGQYDLGGLTVILRDGECRLESGSLAGSVLTMDQAVARMVHEVGIDLVSAVRMASLTPTEAVGLDAERGSLTVGKVADVVILDSSLRCVKTLVEGRIVHARDSGVSS